MSIAKTTRPHLLTREAAAARIEALEAALREIEVNAYSGHWTLPTSFGLRARAALAPAEYDDSVSIYDVKGILGPAQASPAGDRIEALEAALEKMAADSDVELTQLTHAVADNIRKIEALEAALRACVQYHVKAAADCRAIAAVNQDNDLGDNSLNHAVDHDIAAECIGRIVHVALAPEQDK